MKAERLITQDILNTPTSRRTFLKESAVLLTGGALSLPSVPEKATAQQEDEPIPHGIELPITLYPQEIIPADEEKLLPERGSFVSDYLGRPIYFEAPLNGYLHTQPYAEGSPKKIQMEYPDPEDFTTTMSIAAIDLRHLTSLDESVEELVQSIKNTQAHAPIWDPAYQDPTVETYEKGVDGRTAMKVKAIIPGVTGEPVDYINTMFVEDDQTWELAIHSNYLVQMHRWQPYEAMVESFTFLNSNK